MALIVLTVPNRFELHRTKEVPSRMILDGSFDPCTSLLRGRFRPTSLKVAKNFLTYRDSKCGKTCSTKQRSIYLTSGARPGREENELPESYTFILLGESRWQFSAYLSTRTPLTL